MACCLLPSALQLPPPWNFISRPLCKLFPHSKCHLCCLHGHELSLFVQNVTGFQLSSVAFALLNSCNSPWPHCSVSQFDCKVECCILAWELQIYAWSFATQSQSEGSFLALVPLLSEWSCVPRAWPSLSTTILLNSPSLAPSQQELHGPLQPPLLSSLAICYPLAPCRDVGEDHHPHRSKTKSFIFSPPTVSDGGAIIA